MAGPIDRATVEQVAKLASLSLTEAELARMTGEIAAIVKMFGELDAVDVRDVPPTAHVQLEAAAWRDDEPRPCLPRDEVLAAAPRAVDGGFAVPAFVESE